VTGTTNAIRGDATSIGIQGSGTTGVLGLSSTASLTEAGVFGSNGASGGIGVTGEANVGSATGVFGTSSSATGFGMYARNNAGGRALFVDGPASQGLPYGGLVKAMIYVDQFGSIVRCYNGITGSSTAPCGFSVSHPSYSLFTVDFGVKVDDRYVMHQAVYELPGRFTYLHSFPTTNSITFGGYYFSAGDLYAIDLKFHVLVY
jgi:hypothetical protein